MSLLNKSDLETAAAAVRTHRDKARQIREKTAEAEKELASLRAGAGDREMLALDGNYDAGPARSRIRDLEIMLEGLKPAAAKQRERIAQSIGQMQRAKANEIRTAAGKLQGKLDAHLVELRKRLAAVREWEGCNYVPGPPEVSQPGEMGIVSRTGVEILARVTVPKSQVLREEIANLLQQAQTIEQQRVSLAGAITGASLAELLAAAAAPEYLGPGEQAIREWFAETEPKAAAERALHRVAWLPGSRGAEQYGRPSDSGSPGDLPSALERCGRDRSEGVNRDRYRLQAERGCARTTGGVRRSSRWQSID